MQIFSCTCTMYVLALLLLNVYVTWYRVRCSRAGHKRVYGRDARARGRCCPGAAFAYQAVFNFYEMRARPGVWCGHSFGAKYVPRCKKCVAFNYQFTKRLRRVQCARATRWTRECPAHRPTIRGAAFEKCRFQTYCVTVRFVFVTYHLLSEVSHKK